jgi:hypothetical protein
MTSASHSGESLGISYDNALAGTINGLCETKLIRPHKFHLSNWRPVRSTPETLTSARNPHPNNWQLGKATNESNVHDAGGGRSRTG